MLWYPHLPPTASCTISGSGSSNFPLLQSDKDLATYPPAWSLPKFTHLRGDMYQLRGSIVSACKDSSVGPTALAPFSNNPSPQHPSSSPEGSGSSWPCPCPGRVPPCPSCPGPCVLPSSLLYCPLPYSSAICLSVHLSTHPSLHQPMTLWAYLCARCCSWESPVPGVGPHRLKPLLQVHSSSCPLQQGLPWPPALGQSPHLCYPQCRLFTLCCIPHSPRLCQLLGWGQVQD